MAPNHVKRSLLIALKIDDEDSNGTSSAKAADRTSQNLLIDQLKDADKMSLDGNSKLEIKLNVVRGISSQALKTKMLKERFDAAKTAQDFDKIFKEAQKKDSAESSAKQSMNAEQLKNLRGGGSKLGQNTNKVKPYQMLAGPNNKFTRQRFSLFDEFKKNQFSPKAQNRIAALQQFRVGTSQNNKPPRQSPPAVIQQKQRYLEMTQSMS